LDEELTILTLKENCYQLLQGLGIGQILCNVLGNGNWRMKLRERGLEGVGGLRIGTSGGLL
jgi:hypothetical protein